ncbi:CDGSH iron-sulfur domain-containing protein [Streptomyces sp. NPDC017993]|uniref:CDGSH iron-sulfur domain-containing protein n=1 Tax=Streptomyces sp. NPDC017993 TaxID=3365027 RepID=UPI0037A66D51
MRPSGRDARRVTQEPDGPMLIEGPVEVTLADGTIARSDRPTVALCVCRRSRIYPWCDTSHRRRTHATGGAVDDGAERGGAD